MWERDHQLNQKEFNFYRHDWMPQDGKVIDGRKTAIEKVYHADESLLFNDPWEEDSIYRDADIDYEMNGRIKKGEGDGERFEHKKAFYTACAEELQKRLRLDQGPVNSLEAYMYDKQMRWRAAALRTKQFFKKVDQSGKSRGTGGRKSSRASVILSPVVPFVDTPVFVSEALSLDGDSDSGIIEARPEIVTPGGLSAEDVLSAIDADFPYNPEDYLVPLPASIKDAVTQASLKLSVSFISFFFYLSTRFLMKDFVLCFLYSTL